MKKIMLSGLALALFATGCATGTRVLIGTARPVVNADCVKVLAWIPEKSETIGIVSASTTAFKQNGMDACVKKIKKEAGEIGANAVVITGQKNNAWTGTEINGTAIYVP
jgi:hypothetical protein